MEYGHLTVGEILMELDKYYESDVLFLSNGKFIDGSFDSYRGYYNQLTIDFSEEDKGHNTVGEFKKLLKKALNVGIMCGYKGGEYSIDEDTLVWFANYGTTADAEMIVCVEKVENVVKIISEED